jgi:hypothetical protein
MLRHSRADKPTRSRRPLTVPHLFSNTHKDIRVTRLMQRSVIQESETDTDTDTDTARGGASHSYLHQTLPQIQRLAIQEEASSHLAPFLHSDAAPSPPLPPTAVGRPVDTQHRNRHRAAAAMWRNALRDESPATATVEDSVRIGGTPHDDCSPLCSEEGKKGGALTGSR